MSAAEPTKVRPGLFWQWAEMRPGDSFDYRGMEYVVDNCVANPAGGYEVRATPSAVFRTDEGGERCE